MKRLLAPVALAFGLAIGARGFAHADPMAPSGGGGVYATGIYSGQQTVTTSAVALPSQALANGVVITAATANTGTVYVGPSGVTSSTGYPLAAGQSISYALANLSSIYIIGTNTTDAVAFTGN